MIGEHAFTIKSVGLCEVADAIKFSEHGVVQLHMRMELNHSTFQYKCRTPVETIKSAPLIGTAQMLYFWR